MAAREGQGLQIAVIIFAMLTIILAITTFIFYSQSQTALQEKDAAVAAKSQADAENRLYLYRIRAFQYALGLGSKEDMEQAKGALGQADADTDSMIVQFESDMTLFGDQATEPGARNYRTLPAFLLASINKKNTSVVDANELTRQADAAKAQEKAAADKAAEVAQQAVNTATADLAKVQTDVAAERTAMQAEKDKIAAQLVTLDKRLKTEYTTLEKQFEAVTAESTKQQNTIDTQKTKLEELEKGQVDLFENPDGEITWVNQRQRLVWLNVGRADGLMRQTNFAVYDHDETGVASAEPKGSIEVVRIVGDHLAEARIIEDQVANPILPGDIVHTPSWSPGQRIHFAMVGVMDINGDGLDDYALVKNVILLNGGVVDAEVKADGTREGKITVNTRYLVLGERPTEVSDATMLLQYRNIYDEAQKNGTDIIPVQKLLALMGWKVEERTVELEGSGGGDFRRRTPGAKAAPKATPAPGATPAAAPADAAEPMPVDPFAEPAADEPGAKPAPMPAVEADPFADPP
jgi:hypothetical protein